MGLKKFIDNNPLVVLIGVGVAIASATAAVITHWEEQNAENKITKIETAYNNKITKVEADANSKIVKAEAESKSEISTLKIRLSSIERRVGSDESSFFDISKLILTQDRIRELDSTFKTMSDGIFFIAEPAMKDWRYSLTSELAMVKEMTSTGSEGGKLSSLEKIMAKNNVHLWRASETFSFRPEPKNNGGKGIIERLNFFPYVLVQPLSEKELLGISTEVDKLLSKSRVIDEALEKLEASTQELKPASKSAVSTTSSTDSSQKEDLASSPSEATANAVSETEQALSELFRGDVAAVMLSGIVMQNMQIQQLVANSRVVLKTAQKKGNVLYVVTRIEFADVVVEGKKTPGRLIVDQECFVVTSPSGIVFVKVQIPSFDGRAEAYSWIGEWLAGLRIPITK